MRENLTETGLMLTLYGMGTVFTFLVLLIFATRAMSWLALRLATSEQASPSVSTSSAPERTSGARGEILAVITAAVHQHRKAKKPD
ncbi:MAG: OadG family protein [Gammaproteobacteria bacterium]|jgi:oxaloacetate decarboxylase gamma subunit